MSFHGKSPTINLLPIGNLNPLLAHSLSPRHIKVPASHFGRTSPRIWICHLVPLALYGCVPDHCVSDPVSSHCFPSSSLCYKCFFHLGEHLRSISVRVQHICLDPCWVPRAEHSAWPLERNPSVFNHWIDSHCRCHGLLHCMWQAQIMLMRKSYNSLAPRPEWSRNEIWLSLEIQLEKAMAPHSSTLAWKISCLEEPGGLQSMGSIGVGHDWATSLSLFVFMHWRRKWQPTPVFLPGESQGWGCTESDTTEVT